MATARKHLLPTQSVWVHCISRCVRKAFLCGGREGRFDHRRVWVEDRLEQLAGIFAVEIAAYAVMSNHLHVVARMAPEATAAWSARDVVERWLQVFGRNEDRATAGGRAAAVERLSADTSRVAQMRARLADLGGSRRRI